VINTIIQNEKGNVNENWIKKALISALW